MLGRKVDLKSQGSEELDDEGGLLATWGHGDVWARAAPSVCVGCTELAFPPTDYRTCSPQTSVLRRVDLVHNRADPLTPSVCLCVHSQE